MEEKIKQLQKIIDESKNVVFFGGAGVSTESGIKDFRSVDGLYSEKYDYPPEEILSGGFFYSHTQEFYKFYYDKLLIDGVLPNDAHLKLAEMEQKGKLTAVITQNIDGLHQKAGSKTVYELHGSVERNYCLRCGKFYSGEDIAERKKEGEPIPTCSCGGMIKPEVVLYGEGLDEATVNGAITAIMDADTLIVAGTSLTVYPASGLISYFRGKNLVLINKTETSADRLANLVIHGKVGEVLSKIKV
jgi:NAD-dependent deacetylase